jgi:hypothetical protein
MLTWAVLVFEDLVSTEAVVCVQAERAPTAARHIAARTKFAPLAAMIDPLRKHFKKQFDVE